MGQLTFDSSKARYDGERDIVRFSALDGEKLVPCAVSHEALTDYSRQTGVVGDALVQLYRAHTSKIHGVAQEKYQTGRTEADGLVLVKSADLV